MSADTVTAPTRGALSLGPALSDARAPVPNELSAVHVESVKDSLIAQAAAINGHAALIDAATTIAGNPIKAQVRLASVSNVADLTTLITGATLDGKTLALADRIFLPYQTTASQRVIYVVANSGAPAVASDFNGTSDVTGGAVVHVAAGDVNSGTLFVLTTLPSAGVATPTWSHVRAHSAGSGVVITPAGVVSADFSGGAPPAIATTGAAGSSGKVADGDHTHAIAAAAIIAALASSNYGTPSGFEIVVSRVSRTFLVPDWARTVEIIAIGGGGGGGASGGGAGGGGGGGGGMGYTGDLAVTPGQTVTVVIGAGGAAGVDGGDTTVNVNSTTTTGAKGLKGSNGAAAVQGAGGFGGNHGGGGAGGDGGGGGVAQTRGGGGGGASGTFVAGGAGNTNGTAGTTGTSGGGFGYGYQPSGAGATGANGAAAATSATAVGVGGGGGGGDPGGGAASAGAAGAASVRFSW